MTDDLPLFAWHQSAEAAPTPDRYRNVPRPREYAAAWAAWVEAHPETAAEILAMARAHLPSTRCSVDGLFLAVRTQLHTPMNHSFRAAAADHLIATDPRLAAVIERRKRTATR